MAKLYLPWNMSQLDEIALQLKILEEQGALRQGQNDEILDQLKRLERGTPDDQKLFKAYSDSLSKGLPDVTRGIIAAVRAGKGGDPFAITIASLDIFSGIVTMAGPLLGPIGPLVSALTGMVSTILAAFLPKPPNLKDELTEVLDKFLAEALLRQLGTAADQIWIFSDTLEHHSPTAWTPLDLNSGPQVTAIDDTWQYLLQRDKQGLPKWGECLDENCRVFNQLLRAVALSVAYPSTKKDVEPGAMLVYLPARLEKTLERLRAITSVAHKRGTFWHLGPRESYTYRTEGRVYTTDSVVTADVKWHDLGGESRQTAVTPNQGQQGLIKPEMTLFTTEAVNGGSVWGGFDGKGADQYDKDHPFRRNRRTYRAAGTWPPRSGWAQVRPVEDTYDISARPAPSYFPNCLYLLAAYGEEYRGYIVEKDGSARHAWTHKMEASRTAGAIRYVHAPKVFEDDPDAGGGAQNVFGGIDGVYYVGCQARGSGEMDILVRYRESRSEILDRSELRWTEGVLVGPDQYIKGPWRNFRGIGVDQGYLWVYCSNQIACATHAAVRKAIQENRSPDWLKCECVPPDVEYWSNDDLLTGQLDLAPCDDGTLFTAWIDKYWRTNELPISGKNVNKFKLFMLTPRIERKERKIEVKASDCYRVSGEGFHVQKTPLFCWPVVEQLIATLDEQVHEHTRQIE